MPRKIGLTALLIGLGAFIGFAVVDGARLVAAVIGISATAVLLGVIGVSLLYEVRQWWVRRA